MRRWHNLMTENKQAWGINYLLNNYESNIELLPVVLDMEFNMTVDQFIDTYVKEDVEGFYINI